MELTLSACGLFGVFAEIRGCIAREMLKSSSARVFIVLCISPVARSGWFPCFWKYRNVPIVVPGFGRPGNLPPGSLIKIYQ